MKFAVCIQTKFLKLNKYWNHEIIFFTVMCYISRNGRMQFVKEYGEVE